MWETLASGIILLSIDGVAVRMRNELMALRYVGLHIKYTCRMHKMDSVRVKRSVIQRTDSVIGATETVEYGWNHKQNARRSELTIVTSSIRWNERLSCAYKHRRYAISFSTECGTVDQVWHVQIFFRSLLYMYSLIPVFCAYFNSICAHRHHNCVFHFRAS